MEQTHKSPRFAPRYVLQSGLAVTNAPGAPCFHPHSWKSWARFLTLAINTGVNGCRGKEITSQVLSCLCVLA